MSYFRTTNGDYGKPWVTTQGNVVSSQVKTYRDISDTDLKQRTGLKLLKIKLMKEKEIEDIEQGEPDPYVYDPCIPQPKITQLSVRADEMQYPAPKVKGIDNPKYLSNNREYGRIHPEQSDLPHKYFPINNKFTDSFVGGRIPDTGLNTFATPSRVHNLFDS